MCISPCKLIGNDVFSSRLATSRSESDTLRSSRRKVPSSEKIAKPRGRGFPPVPFTAKQQTFMGDPFSHQPPHHRSLGRSTDSPAYVDNRGPRRETEGLQVEAAPANASRHQ